MTPSPQTTAPAASGSGEPKPPPTQRLREVAEKTSLRRQDTSPPLVPCDLEPPPACRSSEETEESLLHLSASPPMTPTSPSSLAVAALFPCTTTVSFALCHEEDEPHAYRFGVIKQD
jgi:hypothetical protein